MNHLLPLGSHKTTGSLICCLRSDGQGRCFLNEVRPPVLLESLRFPQRGRQRERHNSFLCMFSF